MIIIKGQVPHTTKSYTNHIHKKRKKKTSGKRKLSMPVLNSRKPEKILVLIRIRIDFSFFLERLTERSLMSSFVSFQILAP